MCSHVCLFIPLFEHEKRPKPELKFDGRNVRLNDPLDQVHSNLVCIQMNCGHLRVLRHFFSSDRIAFCSSRIGKSSVEDFYE